MVPPPESEDDYRRRRETRLAARRLQGWVRGSLALLTLIPILVFAVAWSLNPYQQGRVWLAETHTQLGLPPCTFKVLTGLPCPSCGMSTSFALFVRGDLFHSVQANVAGTTLALIAMLFMPWALLSAWHGRLQVVRNGESLLVRVVVLFLVLMFARWGIVVALTLWT